MKRTILGMIAGAIVLACASQGASAQSSGTTIPSPTSDDIGADGLKRRGDGTIDDSQPDDSRTDDDIGEDGLKRRGDGSIDASQPSEADHRGRGRGSDREMEGSSGRDENRERGRDRDHERGRDRNRDRDRDRGRDRN